MNQEADQKEEKLAFQRRRDERVHRVLAHSYSFYFFLFIVGVLCDIVFPIRIFQHYGVRYAGIVLLIFGSLLILWAQISSSKLKKEKISKKTFTHGPYCYMRSPTHFGLFFVMLGFGIVANAFFVVLLTVISYLATRLIFVRKQEEILAERYGAPYLEYKKDVKL